MELIVALLLAAAAFAFVVLVRSKDLPEPEPVSPLRHLEERKARIYEGLRDLQFEYRLGKLSDIDYQRTKLDLQKDLAGVMGQMETAASAAGPAGAPRPSGKEAKPDGGRQCPHCGARFEKRMKFCGECGKAMAGGAA